MGKMRQWWIGLAGIISWRSTKRQALLMSKFAATERGSSYDMLAAIEQTQYREMRQKYLHHALDEARHARIFRKRALSLEIDRELAALVDIGYLTDKGIVGEQTLIERFGEIEFLAFVHDAENRGLEHFLVYVNSPHTDQDTKEALKSIAKDEHFHRAYSKAALEKYDPDNAEKHLKAVIWRRYKEAWMRFSQILGTTVSRIWLTLFYFLFILPFRLLSREEPSGWHSKTLTSSIEAAQKQG